MICYGACRAISVPASVANPTGATIVPNALTNTLEQRRTNLRLLAAASSWAALARRLGYQSSTFLIHLAGPNPSRNVTEATARRIEATFGMAAGSFDKPLTERAIKQVAK